MPVAEVNARSASQSPEVKACSASHSPRSTPRLNRADAVKLETGPTPCALVPFGRRTGGLKCVRLAVKRGLSVRLREWEPDAAKGATRMTKLRVGLNDVRPTPTCRRDEQVILGTGKSKEAH